MRNDARAAAVRDVTGPNQRPDTEGTQATKLSAAPVPTPSRDLDALAAELVGASPATGSLPRPAVTPPPLRPELIEAASSAPAIEVSAEQPPVFKAPPVAVDATAVGEPNAAPFVLAETPERRPAASEQDASAPLLDIAGDPLLATAGLAPRLPAGSAPAPVITGVEMDVGGLERRKAIRRAPPVRHGDRWGQRVRSSHSSRPSDDAYEASVTSTPTTGRLPRVVPSAPPEPDAHVATAQPRLIGDAVAPANDAPSPHGWTQIRTAVTALGLLVVVAVLIVATAFPSDGGAHANADGVQIDRPGRLIAMSTPMAAADAPTGDVFVADALVIDGGTIGELTATDRARLRGEAALLAGNLDSARAALASADAADSRVRVYLQAAQGLLASRVANESLGLALGGDLQEAAKSLSAAVAIVPDHTDFLALRDVWRMAADGTELSIAVHEGLDAYADGKTVAAIDQLDGAGVESRDKLSRQTAAILGQSAARVHLLTSDNELATHSKLGVLWRAVVTDGLLNRGQMKALKAKLAGTYASLAESSDDAVYAGSLYRLAAWLDPASEPIAAAFARAESHAIEALVPGGGITSPASLENANWRRLMDAASVVAPESATSKAIMARLGLAEAR